MRGAGTAKSALPPPASGTGHWPSFRGHEAAGSAEGQNLPDDWNPATGANVLWRTTIPGLAHSSPIVWGDLLFVTSAVSSRPDATFKPGLYGDGDASDDRSAHRWMLYAIDKRTGKIRWERTAAQGEPRNKRHIKSTYASSSPATDGRVVVAWFGSQGIYAYDFDGGLRWSVDLGRVDMGAYDIPSYEWGPASSPIIWNGLVIVQCDTQTDSFLLALNAETGETVWKTDRQELPSWGTPTIVTTSRRPGADHQRVELRARLRSEDRPRVVASRWQLEDHRADADLRERSAHCRERPRTGAAGVRGAPRRARRLDAGRRRNGKHVRRVEQDRPRIVHAHAARLPRDPYVLANNGVFDAYDIATGKEIYRQRLPLVGSGYSASPVAADGKIYLSNEDGEMLVIEAGATFKHLATNSMGESLMATPALSEGVMYVRGARTLFAVGKK